MQTHRNLLSYFVKWHKNREPKPDSPKYVSGWLPTPGNITFTLIIAALLICTQPIWANSQLTGDANGTSATTINYQGHLTDASGNPRTGNFAMTFSLWGAAVGGTKIWGSESHTNVPVSNGVFNVGLGSLTTGGIHPSTWGGDRYLQITIDGETLTPRELIRSVPIAGMALSVPDGSISQAQAPFAPNLYHQPDGGTISSVNQPIIYTGWFHGGSGGQQTFDLSAIFTQIDAVTVTKTRTGGGVDTPVTFKVTDATGLNVPSPSAIKISAYDMAGNPASWIQAYVVIVGR